jgi:hypothetical protein
VSDQRWGLALTLVSALRLGAKLVSRRRGVAHVYRGPLTKSGRFVPAGRAVVCGQRTARLSVLLDGLDALGVDGLRLCRRCAPLLDAFPPDSPYAGRVLVTFDDKAAAFEHLTALDFAKAALWCQTVQETHQLGTLMSLVLGTEPLRKPEPGTCKYMHWLAVRALIKRRAYLRERELSPEQRAERDARAAADNDEQIRIQAARTRQARIDRAQDRARRGQYLMPHERELLERASKNPGDK